jgi:hypothetical protein
MWFLDPIGQDLGGLVGPISAGGLHNSDSMLWSEMIRLDYDPSPWHV